MKHPILLNIKKQYPDVKISHKAPANCIQIIEYAFPTCWQHQDFRIITQEYDGKDAYLCWLEIKAKQDISFSLSTTTEDLYYCYQLSGSVLIKQIPEKDEPDNSLDRLNEDSYALLYSSPREYRVRFEQGFHYIFFYVINANWQERHSEQEPIYFQEFTEALYTKKEGFLNSKALSIRPAIRKEILQLASLPRQNGFSTDVMVYVPLARLLAYSKEDLNGSSKERNDSEIEILEAIRGYIKEQVQFGNTRPVDEIAAHFKIGVRRLRYLYKKEYGHNLQFFITTERLDIAETLLLETDETITNIAYTLGYELNSFQKQFRNHFNMYPSEYRKRYKP